MGQSIGLQFTKRFTISSRVGENGIGYFMRRTIFNNRTFQPCRICYEEIDFTRIISCEDAHLSMCVTREFDADDGAVTKQVITGFEWRVFFGEENRLGHIHFLGT